MSIRNLLPLCRSLARSSIATGFLVASLLCITDVANAQLSPIVSPHSGDLVTSNPRGDIFESSGESSLSPRTNPVKRTPPAPPKEEKKEVQAVENPAETDEKSDGNMENMKSQVLERAAEEGGMMAIIRKSQQIKKELGVDDSQDSAVNVDKKMIENRLKGVQKAIETSTSPEDTNRF